jgi:16S rRNA (cytosine967-C5)-methyltransferase
MNKPDPNKKSDPLGLAAAARVLAAGGRVPKKFAPSPNARPASAGPTLQAKASQAKLSPARRAAFEILQLVAAGKGHSDELLHRLGTNTGVPHSSQSHRDEWDLSTSDQNLATALVMGVLRWQIALDARIRPFLQRPDQRLAEPVAIALRLGALQLLHMDRIPAHAALSESVELTRAAGNPHASGMVNAVLRKLSAAPKSPAPPIFERPAVFAERLGHPLWLVERWVAAYGPAAALAICEADQTEPGEFEKTGDASLFDPDETLPQIDPGSRLVAELAAAALPSGTTRVWDSCAAPGGKTLVLAARLPQTEILATDISTRRLGQMQSRLRRHPSAANIKTAVADAATLPTEAGLFDLILCDVPCSGTGTLARNPEIRHHLTPLELTRQATRQQAILSAALARLAPGGRLIYSTCSLEPEENEQVIATVPEQYTRIDIAKLLPNILVRVPDEHVTEGSVIVGGIHPLRSEAVQNGNLRTLPGLDPCDGFFAAIFERPIEKGAP